MENLSRIAAELEHLADTLSSECRWYTLWHVESSGLLKRPDPGSLRLAEQLANATHQAAFRVRRLCHQLHEQQQAVDTFSALMSREVEHV